MALVHIALNGASGPVQAQQVARDQGIPKQYLDQLMMTLRAAGFVVSARGRQGGYTLARPARDITLLDVVTTLEGPVHNLNFAAKGRRRVPARGILKGIWDDLWSQSITTLRAHTLEEICRACRVEDEAINYDI